MTIALIASELIGIPFSANTVPVALRVDDVAAAREALEARGVAFLGDIIDSGVCHMANFQDPDGNALMSTTATPPSPAATDVLHQP